MDYQTLFETGELTPMQLRAWMAEDPVNAGRALRQRPALMSGLRDILSAESTAPEVNRPVSAYDQIGDMREDLFGVDSDDMLLTRVAKGLGDAVASPIALGAAGADYLKAGFNELTGNEEGLQFEDTPDASDLIGDAFNTGLAAFTGGAGNVLKAGAGNLFKNGLKNTLGKAKGKVLGSTTGKALLGGPKRQLATGIGAASVFGGPEEDADENAANDIINTAPKTSTEAISSADLDQPITDPVTGRQSAVSLDNPDTMLVNGQAVDNSGAMSNAPGLLASSNNIGNFRTIDPKDKSLEAFQRRGIQRDLNAQAGRQVREDIAKQQRINKINQRQESLDQNIREAWQNSPTNKAGVPFEQLSPADQMRMRENYMASKRAGSYNSADEAAEIRNRKMLDELDRSGGYAVNYRDPENKRNLPGQISLKDAKNRADRADSKPAPVQTNVFDSVENQSVTLEPSEDEVEMNPMLKYGLPIAGAAALLHPGTRKKGAEMLKKGLNVFKKTPPPAAKNPWTSTAGGYTGKTPEQLGKAAANAPKSMSNPWASTAGGYTGRTPQDLGRAVNNAPKSMSNPWASTAGGYTGRTPQDLGRAANMPPKVKPETPWASAASTRPPARTPQDIGAANRPAPQSPWSSTSSMQTPKPAAITPQDIGRASAPAAQTPWSSARNTRPPSPPATTPQDIGFGNRVPPASPWVSSRNIRPQSPQVPAATPQSVGAANRQAAEIRKVNDYVDGIADADYARALKSFGLGENVSREQLKNILGKTSFGRLSLDNL